MKFLHTSDLHLGKTVHDFSMLEDQRFLLNQIAGIARAEQADAVAVAGDVYDRSIPPAQAVMLLNGFLEEMVAAHIPVLLISGNHDSPERLSFAHKALQKSGIYIAGGLDEPVRQVTLTDDLGPVHFFLMPFFKPAVEGEKTSEEAVRQVLSRAGLLEPRKERCVLVTHFFVTAGGQTPELSEAETSVDVGGIDNVDASLFAAFDYTALGHIHKAQRIGGENICYSGAPAAYSFSEAGADKSVRLVTLGEKGEIKTEERILHPLHRMRMVEGAFRELMQQGVGELEREDYVQIRLTDREELIDPIGQLRSVYPNVMQLVFTGREGRETGGYVPQSGHRQKSVPEMFACFYEAVREEPIDSGRAALIEQAVKDLVKED